MKVPHPRRRAWLLIACLAALAVPSHSGGDAETSKSPASPAFQSLPAPGLRSVLASNPGLLPELGLTQAAVPALQRVLAQDPSAARRLESASAARQADLIRFYVRAQANAAFEDREPGAFGEQWFEKRESLIRDLEKLGPLLSRGRTEALGRTLDSLSRGVAWDGERGPEREPAAPAGDRQAGATATLSPYRSREAWQKAALAHAGIDEAAWAPEKGFRRNRQVIEKVYAWYGQAGAGREGALEWPGWAKLAGGVVFQGLTQIQRFKTLYIGDPVFGRTQVALLVMHKAIFMDLGWQIHAYREEGVSALQDQFDQGQMSLGNLLAWRAIDLGYDAAVRAGNMALLRREQELIVQPGYEDLKTFPKIPKRMSQRLKSPLPEGQRFARAIPGGDVTDFNQRWSWIKTDLIARWSDLYPAERQRLIQLPLARLAKRRFQPFSWKSALKTAAWMALPVSAVALPALVAYWAHPFSTGVSYPVGDNNFAEDVLRTSPAQGLLNWLIAVAAAVLGALAYGGTLLRRPSRQVKTQTLQQISGAIAGTILGAAVSAFVGYMLIGTILLYGGMSKVPVHHFAEASVKLAAVAGALIGAFRANSRKR